MGEIVLGGRYVIENEIGAGGMAIVYKAHDRMLNRDVAIKVLRPEFKQDEEFIKRFDVEAKSAAGLNHPNIVAIYDVGIHEGLRYIVMEYVKGETLKNVIRAEGCLSWETALEYAAKICAALDHAHKRKIIHRDIKPHNIMVTEDGMLKVMDFGIARATSSATMTIGAKVLGSAHYLSPEQARGGFTDERSDLYSLGVCLYEMVTGRVPFDADTTIAVAMQHLQKDVQSPKEIVPELPDSVEYIIMKAMRKEQAQRYLSAQAMESDILTALTYPEIIPNDEDNEAYYSTKQIDVEEDVEEEEEDEKKADKTILVVLLSILGVLVAIVLIAFAVFSFVNPGNKGNKTGGEEETWLNVNNDEIKAPLLKGLTLEEAEEEIKKIDSDIELIVEYRYSKAEEKNKILEQNPASGNSIPSNDKKVMVVISKGGEFVEIESYIGEDYETVKEELLELGITTRREFEEDDDLNEKYDEGIITRQDREPGSTLIVGEFLTLYVSEGSESVDPKLPDLAGMDPDSAKIVLREKGYYNIVIVEEESEDNIGNIIRQSPKKDTRVNVDEKITLYVAKEKMTQPKGTEITFTVPDDEKYNPEGNEYVNVKVIKSNGDTVFRGAYTPLSVVTITVKVPAGKSEVYEISINNIPYEEKRVQG